MASRSFSDLYREAEKNLDFWVAGSVVDFTENVSRLMKLRGVNRTELARRLGTSQAYVTKLLCGEANFTLTTLVKVSLALESELKLHLTPKNSVTRRFDVPGASIAKARARVAMRNPAANEVRGRAKRVKRRAG